ncbi:UNVERIFIED_CONTAM: hypothetical protein FKN15_067079 [Acipenser sinensis]
MYSFAVSELSLPGAQVGRLSALDPDVGENAALEYSILDGDGGGAFNLTTQEEEGVLTLNQPLDFERRQSFVFRVEVVNTYIDPLFLRRGPFKDVATVRVAVLDADEPPRFSEPHYSMGVQENSPPLTAVGRVAARDPDTVGATPIR